MASNYTKTFTLTDIFNNKKLRNKIPLIRYKETLREDGKVSVRTSPKTINRLVFDTATSSARPFYNPIETHRAGNQMTISGNLVGDHNACVDAVYNAIRAKKTMLIWTANNTDMIRDALKEGEKNKRKYGFSSKLFLRAQSMQEIEGMTQRQIQALMNDIMENIILGDNFPETQKKYGVAEWNWEFGYQGTKARWRHRVGDF